MSDAVLRRYTFKLYPTAAQAEALDRQRVMAAQLWNALLEQREVQWAHECQRKAKGDRQGLNYMRDQSPQIKALRAACPEWQVPASTMLHRVAENLEEAFAAFFRRAKAGAGRASGYPRYKSVRHADGIPFRNMQNSGSRLDAAESGGKNWRLFVKGVPGLIKLRGQFPAAPESIRNMDLMLRDGAWWMFVCVRIERRRVSGSADVTVRLDLIDEFARVERVDGGRAASSSEQTTFARGLRSEAHAQDGQRAASERGTRDGLDCVLAREEPSQSAREGGDRGEVPPEHRPRSLSQSAREQTQEPDVGNLVGFRARTGSEHWLSQRFAQIALLDARKDAAQREMDTASYKRGSWRHRRAKRRVAALMAKAARLRRDTLHVWSSHVTRDASRLTVVAPAIREITASPRGDERNWGAAVEVVSALNRNILSQAPAAAIAMLTYKAEEAAIEFVLTKDETPVTAVGRDLVTTTKTARRARRELRKAA